MAIERTHEAPQGMLEPPIVSHVILSNCERYRFILERSWNKDLGMVNFVMLNPSTATESVTDPTAKRCGERAKRMGYGGFIITNLYGLRATDPRELADPTINPISDGIDSNDTAIKMAAAAAAMVICAWGDSLPKSGIKRVRTVLNILSGVGADKIYHLGLNKSGNPKHPLYISYEIEPQIMRQGAQGA